MLKSPIKTRLSRKYVRNLITSAASYINPEVPLAQLVRHHIGPFTKSLLLAVTPNYAQNLHTFIREEPLACSSIVGLACDAIPFGCQKNAVSLMAFDNKMSILDGTLLTDDSKQSNSGTNWQLTSSLFSADLTDKTSNKKQHNFVISLANTLFETGIESHLLVRDSSHQFNGQFLSALKINMEDDWDGQLRSHVSLIELAGFDEPLVVTSAVQNMLKTVNGRPAASILQSNPLLTQPQHDLRERKVFMETLSSDLQPSRRYEVIAGGGETWSPRSSMLVVEPPAIIKPNDRIRFSMTTGIFTASQYASSPYPSFIKPAKSPQICLECAPVLDTAGDSSLVEYASDTHIVNQFGMASERGFIVNGLNHEVSGETVTLIRR